MSVSYEWRGRFANDEINVLHAEAFNTRIFASTEWNWVKLTSQHSLGWVTARDGKNLVGFVNVLWDGSVHAWLQDTMVSRSHRHAGVGSKLVSTAVDGVRSAGCEWLHVDFDDGLERFYIDACGFTATRAGLMSLSQPMGWPSQV
ncbi:MAG: GNAT family N-acetyltransferase [Acidimicrobiia bacterium]|nr:GNAT family N-acetyltransferase [Acidimicrobiia bacterium]